MAKQDKWIFPAPPGSRLIAYLLDVAMTQILFRGICLVAHWDTSKSDISNSLITLGYFVVLQSQFGWTPGKKIMGLELINVDDEGLPSLKTVILRETLGRFITAISLMLGYLMIFVTEHKQCLHDRIAGTRVITLHDPSSDGHSIFKVLAWTIGLGLASVGLSIYIGFFTAIPLKYFADVIENVHGIHVERISGNLFRGFKVGHVTYSGPKGKVSIGNLIFHYQDLLESLQKRELRIIQVSATQCFLDLSNSPPDPFPNLAPMPEKNRNTLSETSQENLQKNKTAFSVLLEKMELTDVRIRYAGKDVLQAESILLADFNVSSSGNISLGKFSLNSQKLSISMDQLSFMNNILKFNLAAASIRKEFDPEHLSGEIDLHGRGIFDYTNRKVEGEFQGFRNSMSLRLVGDSIRFQLSHFQPHWYFRKTPPLHSINLVLAPTKVMNFSHARGVGTFSLGRATCEFESETQGELVLPSRCRLGDKIFFANFKMQSGNPPFVLSLRSQHFDGLAPLLAEAGGFDNRDSFFSYENNPDVFQFAPLRMQNRSPAGRR